MTEISHGCISGPKGGFYEISINEFFEWLTLGCRVLIEGSSSIREQDIWKISLGELRVRQGWSWSGGIENITETERKEIQSFFDIHLDKYFSHELCFRTRQSAFRYDYRSALLWDVIALETLINLIYNNWFDNVVIQENKNIPNRANKLRDNIARDLELTSIVQLISYVAIPKEKQPSDEVIQKAVKAISVRNKITHSLRSKTGEYHSQIINNNELVEARKAIRELTKILINFVKEI